MRSDVLEAQIRHLRKEPVDTAAELRRKYQIGELALFVTSGQGNYGRRSIASLAEALNEAPTTVYDCRRFAARYSEDDLRQLQRRNLPWRNIVRMVTSRSPYATKRSRTCQG
jgi:hypothetical protein